MSMISTLIFSQIVMAGSNSFASDLSGVLVLSGQAQEKVDSDPCAMAAAEGAALFVIQKAAAEGVDNPEAVEIHAIEGFGLNYTVEFPEPIFGAKKLYMRMKDSDSLCAVKVVEPEVFHDPSPRMGVGN